MALTRGRRRRQPQWAAPVSAAPGDLRKGLVLLSYDFGTANIPPNRAPGAGAYITDFSSFPPIGEVRDGGPLGPVRGVRTASSLTLGYRPNYTALNTLFAATGGATVLAVIRSAAQDGSGETGPFHVGNGGSFEHYPFTDGKIYLGPLSGTRWVNAITPPVAVTQPHCVVATHKSGEQAFYMAGQLLASNTLAETPGILTNGTATIGGNGAVYLIAIWSRALTQAQALSLSRNPWQLTAPSTRRIWIPAAAAGASAITAAAGVATTSTLTGSSTAASTVTASAGVATDSTLTGSSIAAATLTAAAGVATDSTLTGSSAAAATVTAAAGVATASTLSSGSGSGLTAAAGVATTSTLTGSSVAAATVTAAAGVATGSTLTGSVGAPIITPAAGVATGGTLAGSSVAVASIVAAAGVATSATVSTIPPAGSTGAVILLPIRLISGVYTTTGVVASRALQNLKAALPNRSVPAWQQDGTMTPQWYRYHQMFVDVFIGSAAAYTLDDIVNSVVTSQANATQQALTTSAIAQQLQGVAEATAVVKQVAVTNSLSGADQIPDVPLSYGMEP